MLFKQVIISAIFLISCDTGKLNVVASIPNHLKEVSAVETIPNSNLFWMIEDAGNDNHLYALDANGNLKKDLTILNSTNIDWEDLTSDKYGNIYIGDFGNNDGDREQLTIYKVPNPSSAEKRVVAEKIDFKLPNDLNSRNFEAFFLLDDYFYIFSKSNTSSDLIKVRNQTGIQTAQLISDFKIKGKHHKITSADISDNGQTIVLLNHDKLWKITNYEDKDFLKGRIEEITFEHNSQKEGICFANDSVVLITDESNGSFGSNLYSLNIN